MYFEPFISLLVSLGEDNERVYCKEMAEMMEREGGEEKSGACLQTCKYETASPHVDTV